MLFVLAFLLGLSLAQRPSNLPLCDYYAETQYGSNTNDTQAKLIIGIVSLAFGGPFNLPNVSTELTGILNPGKFSDQSVDLQPYFNGSIDSTNLNNAPVGINWLDGGGTQPLSDFLTGKTPQVVINNSTNQYRLFNHFFVAFSHVFGCSQPIPSLPSSGSTGGTQQLSLAYVHKYMDLNYTDLGYFIDQFGQASLHFGFSEQDTNTFTGNLNQQYNVRCAPAVSTNPTQGPQLLSLCQDPSCPLAAPSPDCAAYQNLQPGGYSANSTSSTAAPASTSSSSSTSTTTSSTTAAATTAPAQTTSSSDKSASSNGGSNGLSGGAIAGIAIGAAVVVLMAAALGLFYCKKGRHEPFTPSSTYISQAYTDPHGSYASHPVSPPGMANVERWNAPPPMRPPPEHWTGPPIAEMDSSGYGHSPEMPSHDNRWSNIYPPSNPSNR